VGGSAKAGGICILHINHLHHWRVHWCGGFQVGAEDEQKHSSAYTTLPWVHEERTSVRASAQGRMWRRNQLFSRIPCRDPDRPRLMLRIACLGWPLYAYLFIGRFRV
jgi:hypothetical protein